MLIVAQDTQVRNLSMFAVSSLVEMDTIMTEEDKILAYKSMESQLHMEQVMFKHHRSMLKAWESRLHEDFYSYNSVRMASIDELAVAHCTSHFPTQQVKNADAVEPAINLLLGNYADKVDVQKSQVFRVFLANLSYLGTNAGSMTMDLARLVGDLVATDPSRTCAIVIFSNAWDLVSAATGELKRRVPGERAVLSHRVCG